MSDFREFILFECLTALIVGHAWLQSIGTVMQNQVVFYTVVLVINLLCMLWIYVDYKEEGVLVDYNENLTQQSYVYILLGVIGVFVASAIITRAWTPSVIYVPTFAAVFLDVFTGLGSFVTAFLYNFALISNSEETTKLVGHNALYMYLTKTRNWTEDRAKLVAIAAPIGFWATLHAYVAYVGALMWPLVVAAFVAGLIIFAVMWKTRSLLAAIITHALYNLIVLTAAGLGWIALTVSPIALTAWAVLNLTLLMLIRRQKSSARLTT